jgi:hypothetical protein
MAFDKTDPADLLALKNEVNLDPTGQDYASAGGATQPILTLLNDPEANVSNDTINRPTEELDIPDIAEVIDPGEYGALGEYDQEWVKMFINRPAEETLRPYQGKFLSIFGAASATRAAALALRQKDASRAEVLFGVNTVITRADWIAARES